MHLNLFSVNSAFDDYTLVDGCFSHSHHRVYRWHLEQDAIQKDTSSMQTRLSLFGVAPTAPGHLKQGWTCDYSTFIFCQRSWTLQWWWSVNVHDYGRTCVCCSWAKSLKQSTSNGAICTVTVYIQISFEDISFSSLIYILFLFVLFFHPYFTNAIGLHFFIVLFSGIEATCRVRRLINWHVTYIRTYIQIYSACCGRNRPELRRWAAGGRRQAARTSSRRTM